ncbi:nuclease A inhibitor family protein [Pedobacter cryoconitis]|uniref:Nuclease A inhibitor-like protein n=1 Tax=Pedobacter cryoconitis TaxID=188932 RepID=A0A327RRW0_9SPHI|nr:nuclease A inhibitor family protein [Pedobacter cryoconitis]RAJ19750.1 nuclease A inhibitor-like protein [Pedobacter cryoconitis]
MEKQILTELAEKTQGLFYFSESEAPLTIENLGQVPKDQLSAKLVQLNSENPGTLQIIDQDAFFEKIVNTADPGDQVMVANARKFTALQAYLKDNFSDIQLARIEGGVNVPILITAYLPNGTCILLATYAIET